jgi:integrase
VLRRAAGEAPELACFLVLAAATGARRSELVALRWTDVDLDGGTVSISRGVVFGPDGLVEKGTKTHTARRVALDERTLRAVAEHRDRMRERAAFCRVPLRDDAFVFSNAADCSEPWFPDSVSRAFKRLCAAEGLRDVRLHDLRHFVATQLLSAGVDVRTVAGRLGHRNAATTLNVYAHFLQQADRAAADVIGDVISPGEERDE